MKRHSLNSYVAVLGIVMAIAVGGYCANPDDAAKYWPQTKDAFMGDYEGSFTLDNAQKTPVYARVVPLGGDEYLIALYLTPYPIYNPEALFYVHGTTSGNVISFESEALPVITMSDKNEDLDKKQITTWKGTVSDGKLVATANGSINGQLETAFIERHSPTEAAPAPNNAIVLLPYDGATPPSLDAFIQNGWRALEGGAVEVGQGDIRTKNKFGDIQLHLEFALPFMPEERGQGRANSGVYLCDRYEIQVLDSFGLIPQNNECGGIYQVAIPMTNASYPPMAWQTYDILFRAPRFDENCEIVQFPLVTIKLNGITIHENQPIWNSTGGGPGHSKINVLRLQDHGNLVHYRNIWLIERNDMPYTPNN